MAQIKQIGVGRKTTGTIDGITYYVLNGKTFARSTPNMPASVYTSTEARIRQAIFKFIQMHMKHHLRTIRQTITAKTGSPCNRYYSLNGKALSMALQTLAEQYVDGLNVTITEIEAAISAYAAEHPTSITIASKSGYAEVYLTGAWPDTITLNASGGDSTMIIIVSENGVTTTINPDGSTVVSGSNGSNSSNGLSGSSSGTSDSGGTSTGSGSGTITAPVISGTTPFDDSTTVTITAAEGASIKYTTNGVAPSATYGNDYEEPITLNATATVKAVAIVDGVASEVASKVFTKNGESSGGEEGM